MTPSHSEGSEGCIIHGLGEHSGRYHPTVESLLRAPSLRSIRLFDFPGHGRSAGRRGDGVRGFASYVDVIGEVLSDHPQVQWVWAHSMGALALFSYLEQCQTIPAQLKQLVLSAIPFEVVQQPTTLERLALPVLRKVAAGLVLPTHIQSSQISSMATEQKKYESDPLVHCKISVRVYDGLVNQTHNYAQRFVALVKRSKLCVLLAHGHDDTIASIKGCDRIQQRMKDEHPEVRGRVSVRVYDSSRHEIHHDQNRAVFLKDLIAWVSV